MFSPLLSSVFLYVAAVSRSSILCHHSPILPSYCCCRLSVSVALSRFHQCLAFFAPNCFFFSATIHWPCLFNYQPKFALPRFHHLYSFGCGFGFLFQHTILNIFLLLKFLCLAVHLMWLICGVFEFFGFFTTGVLAFSW